MIKQIFPVLGDVITKLKALIEQNILTGYLLLQECSKIYISFFIYRETANLFLNKLFLSWCLFLYFHGIISTALNEDIEA